MGGGSGSGAISHSEYMETVHKNWLNLQPSSGLDINRGIVEVMNTALTAGSSPFLGALAYNPDADVQLNSNLVTTFKAAVDALDYTSDMVAAINTVSGILVADT